MTKQAETSVEQICMERYVQPSGVEIKLCLLEIPVEGLVGYPYTVERKVEGRWQQRDYGLTYGKAMLKMSQHRDFEKSIGSLFTLRGNADIE